MRLHAHFSGGLSLVAAAVVAGALNVPPAAGAACGQASAVERMRCLVNGVRRSHGLRPLRVSRLLDRSATLRAGAIRRCGTFSHTPCGQSFEAPFVRVGYFRGNVAIAENLAWGESFLGEPERVVDAWLRSPEHRANLLGRRWREVGVALVEVESLSGGRHVRVWVTQFGRRG